MSTTAGGSAARAYVVDRNGLMQVVDTGRGVVLTTADTGGRTTGVAVAPDGKRVYVVNGWVGSVAAVDPYTGEIVERLHTQTQLAQAVMRPDGERLYVSGSSSVAVIEPQTFRLIAAIRVGGQPQGLAISPDNRVLYVANAQDGTVSVVDTDTASQMMTVKVGGLPQQLAVSPDGAFLYVSGIRLGEHTPGTVTIIDTARNAVVASVPVGKGAGSLAVTPDGATVYVALPKERAVAVVDIASRTVRRTLQFDAPGVATAPGDRRIFLATGATTTVLDSADNAVLTTYGMESTGFARHRDHDFEATMITFAPQPRGHYGAVMPTGCPQTKQGCPQG